MLVSASGGCGRWGAAGAGVYAWKVAETSADIVTSRGASALQTSQGTARISPVSNS